MVVGAHQSFQFFRQNTWFLKNKRALSKFLYGILHDLISIAKFLKESVYVNQFYINYSSHNVWLVSGQRPVELERKTLP